MKKYISWNVNGFRAVMNKNAFLPFVEREQPDAICLQETKMQEGQAELTLPGYHQYWAYAEKKGYSGTAVFTKEKPLSVRYGMGIEEHDHEGRVIALEYPDYWLVTEYVPNAKEELQRLAYRQTWEDDFLWYLKQLEKTHSEDEPRSRRFHGRGEDQVHGAAECRFCRYLALFLSR